MDTHRPALSGPFHALAHGLIVMLGWTIFVWGWWSVGFEQFRTPALPLLILITLIVAPLVTLYWVGHNREIFDRKGQRRGARSVTESYYQDWAGRQIHAQFASLRHAPQIIINSTSADKYFVAHMPSPPSPSET